LSAEQAEHHERAEQSAKQSIVSKPGSKSKRNLIGEPSSDPGKVSSEPDEHQQRAEWSIISRTVS
jgi:hypothetical protein